MYESQSHLYCQLCRKNLKKYQTIKNTKKEIKPTKKTQHVANK